MKQIVFIASLSLLLLIPGLSPAQDQAFTIVGNLSSTPSRISKVQLTRIALKRVSRWPNGQPAELIDLKQDNQVKEQFYGQVVGKTLSMVKSHWQAQVFSGRARPPKTFASDQAVIDYVRHHPGSFGYIASATRPEGVQVITVSD